jgi:predicted ribonuclease YlaK
MITEKKVEYFDSATIDILISGNEEAYQIISNRAKVLPKGSVSTESLEKLQDLNPGLPIGNNLVLSENVLDIFKAMGISVLHPRQELCMSFCLDDTIKSPMLIKFDIGYGKTSLCLALAMVCALEGL